MVVVVWSGAHGVGSYDPLPPVAAVIMLQPGGVSTSSGLRRVASTTSEDMMVCIAT